MKKWLLIIFGICFTSLSFASPLPASEVFQVNATYLDANNFQVHFQIKPGYFLYKDKIAIKGAEQSNVHIGHFQLPEALDRQDKHGRHYWVYRNELILTIPVLGEYAGEAIKEIHYQGCSDEGFCYPPEIKEIKLTIDKELALKEVSLEGNKVIETTETLASEEAKNNIEAIFDKDMFIVILSFLGLGILLSLTPCVLPMIPILSGIIVGHGKNISTKKAFLLSLSYVLSMSFTYALIGAIAASLGANLQIIMQSTIAIGLFSLIFVLLALSMFGFYDIRMPSFIQTSLAPKAKTGGHYLGAALMGFLSTLIVSPCVTAPLVGALGYIAQSGNILLGSLALFFMGFGMGFPLLLLGLSAGKLLPKTGSWMNVIKSFFGVILLALAIYLLQRILPGVIIMVLWATLLVFVGVYCGAFTSAQSNQAKFFQALGLLFITYGVLILIGASMGKTDPFKPLAPIMMTGTTSALEQEKITNLPSLETALNEAKGKPVMLDFYADWCASCKEMESTTFKNPQLREKLNDWVIIKVDVTANTKEAKALLQQFNVIAPPTFLFFNKDGKELSNLRLVGEISAPNFIKQLAKIN